MENIYIKVFAIFTSLALIISLILNFTLLSKLNHIETQIEINSQSISDVAFRVDDQTSNLQNIINEMKEEQSWISRIIMELNETDIEKGKVVATFEWQVKELQNDSEIMFHYAFGTNEEYTSMPAEMLQQGIYQVKVPLEIEMAPEWIVHISTNDTNQGVEEELIKDELEQRMYEEQVKGELKYYVTVSYGDLVKSGEVETDNIGYLGTEYYGILQTDVNFYEGKVFVHLVNQNAGYSNRYVEEAYLLKYEGSELIGEEALELDKNNISEERFFHLNEVEQYENMRLVLKVVYNNGDVFEEEVY